MRPDEWMADAACRSYMTELWFPDTSWRVNGGYRHVGAAEIAPEAAAICEQCPVKPDCLTYALENMVDGIWAATSPPERGVLRRQLGITARPLVPLDHTYTPKEATPA